MSTELLAAVQGLKTTYELIKAAHGLSNYSELLSAVTDVQIKLTGALATALDTQEKLAVSTDRVRELEKQIAEAKDWKTEMQRYALCQFPTGALAYALKPGAENGQPMHYLCTACVDKKKKTTLQPISDVLHCPECKTYIHKSVSQPVRVETRRRESW